MELGDILTITRQQESELPSVLSVVYINKNTDYQQGAQQARRASATHGTHLTVELAIVMDDTLARRVAETLLYNTWIARTRYQWVTTKKYSKYEPTDTVTIGPHTILITHKNEGANGTIEWQGVSADGFVYTQTITGAGGEGFPEQEVISVVPTDLYLIDCPLLNDADDNAGFYAAMAGSTGWRAASLYKSSDGGNTYAFVMSNATEATMGYTDNTLGGFAGGYVFDETNTLTVFLTSGTLSSLTELQVLNYGNVALVGNEIIQFRDAVLIADNTYQLSGLLRGQKGTEWAIYNHVPNERFVLLELGAISRVSQPTTELNLSRYYKPVSFGDTLQNTTEQAFINTGVGLKPLSPVQFTGTRDGSGNLTINWVHRTRLSWDSLTTDAAPLGEQSEAYELEVVSAGGVVLRTVTGLTSPTFTYTAAMQAADFAAPFWTQIGGDSLNSSWAAGTKTHAYTFAVDGILYAVVRGGTEDGEIWRYVGGTWQQIGGDLIMGGTFWTQVLAITSFATELYVAVVESNALKVYKFDGSAWTKIGGDAVNGSWTGTTYSFGPVFQTFNAKLYLALGGTSAGAAEVWSWDGAVWTKEGGDGVNTSWNTSYEYVLSLLAANGKLYAGLGYSSGDAEVWAYDGTAWTLIGGDAVAGSWAATGWEGVYALAWHGGLLYAGLGASAGDAEVWSYDGLTWVKVGGDALNASWANSTFETVFALLSHSNGRLYAGLGDSASDAEVWEYNGSTWTKIAGDAVRSSWNTGYERVNTLAELSGSVYVGLGSSAGDAEVWVTNDPANAVPNPITVKVYQMSAVVGRGFPGVGAV